MKTVHILFYSGTGNTRRALGIVSKELAGLGYTPLWHDLSLGRPRLGQLNGDELLLVGFPALGFSAPYPVIKALRALPRLEGLSAAVLCSCGATWIRGAILPGWGGTAALEAARILKTKGLRVIGMAEASYPENWRQVSRPATGAEREALLNRGDADALRFAADIRSALETGRPRLMRRGLVTLLLMPLVARLFRRLARFCLARLFVADEGCAGCGICARDCPSEAIRMKKGLPAWSLACSACNRCINLCPHGAIQSSSLRLVLVLGLNIAAFVLAFPAAGTLLRALEALRGGLPAFLAGSLAKTLLALLLYVALTWLQVGPLDAALRFFERWAPTRRAFTRSFTKPFPPYLAPGFEKDARRGPR